MTQTHALSKKSSYSKLRQAILKTIRAGKSRALKSVERELLKTKWEVGHLILEHLLAHQSRAEYGAELIKKLSKDLQMNPSSVHYMIEFARTYQIFPTSGKLGWSHYQELLAVNDSALRKEMEQLAKSGDWTVKVLRLQIKKRNHTKIKLKKTKMVLKATQPAAFDVFRLRVVNEKKLIDLGFSTYLRKADLKEKIKIVDDREFTYRAEVERVVDGDTIWCLVDLGLGVETRQKLRLKSIDAPELNTPEGKKAKSFLTRKLSKGRSFILKTSKSDKFDRYLADIWFEGEWINQSLVREGHALIV